MKASSPVTLKYDQSGSVERMMQPQLMDKARALCIKVDTVKPSHCSEDKAPCNDIPLTVTERITKNPSVNVTFFGWSDPTASGLTEATVSGIKEYHIEGYEMTSLGEVLGISATIHFTEKAPAGATSKIITLPADQVLYTLIFTAKDNAGNFYEARRLVLYDSSSVVKVDTNKKIWSPTGNEETDYRWQIVIGDVIFSWKLFFFNSFQQKHNMLKPVRPDTSRFDGKREQTTGNLNITGTPNVDGIINFHYSTTKNKSDVLSLPHDSFDYTEVPDFLNQNITLTSLNIEDGDRIFFLVKASRFLRFLSS